MVEQAARAALRVVGYMPLCGIRCEFDHGLMVLRGQVPSYYLRKIAYATVSKVVGVVMIDDQVKVA